MSATMGATRIPGTGRTGGSPRTRISSAVATLRGVLAQIAPGDVSRRPRARRLSQIIGDYGSLEAYREEQRRIAVHRADSAGLPANGGII